MSSRVSLTDAHVAGEGLEVVLRAAAADLRPYAAPARRAVDHRDVRAQLAAEAVEVDRRRRALRQVHVDSTAEGFGVDGLLAAGQVDVAGKRFHVLLAAHVFDGNVAREGGDVDGDIRRHLDV